METPKVESKISKTDLFGLLFGFVLMTVIGVYLSSKSTPSPFIDGIWLLSVLIFFGFALGCLIVLWVYFPQLKIYADRIEISYWGGLRQWAIPFSDIDRVEIRLIMSQLWGRYTEKFVIHTVDRKKFRISESGYDNYNELKNYFKKYQVNGADSGKNARPNSILSEQKVIVAIFIGCLLCMGFSYYMSTHYKLDRATLTEVQLTLEKKPEIKKGRRHSFLVLPVREYPDFNFNLSGTSYTTTYLSEFIKNGDAGKQVYFLLDKDEYRQKLKKDARLTFWNKYFKYTDMRVYGLRDETMIYLNPDDYERASRSDYQWSAVLFVGITIYFLYASRNDILKFVKR